MKTAEELRGKIDKVMQLHALPDNAMRAVQKLNSEKTTASEVAREIAKEPAFSAQVLRLVNSGFYGFSTPVTSIAHATVLVGFSVMKTIILSSSIVGAMPKSMSGLWIHSLACARVSTLLGRFIGLPEPEELSAAGLLHDVGKIVMGQFLPEEYHSVVKTAGEADILFLEAEQKVLPITHIDVAKWLLKKWNLPQDTSTPITEHHAFDPSAPLAERIAIVHLADILVRAVGCGWGGDSRMPALNGEAVKMLNLEVSHMQTIMEQMASELKDIQE